MPYIYQIEQDGVRDEVCFGPFDDMNEVVKAALVDLQNAHDNLKDLEDLYTIDRSDLRLLKGSSLDSRRDEVYKVHVLELKTFTDYRCRAEFQRVGSDDMLTINFTMSMLGAPSYKMIEDRAGAEVRRHVKDPAGWMVNSVDLM